MTSTCARFARVPRRIPTIIGKRMTSKEGAKRKAANYPSEVIDLVDDSSDTEDAGLLSGNTRREVIDLVDDNDESKARAHRRKITQSWEVGSGAFGR
jgi:hypothetical protein